VKGDSNHNDTAINTTAISVTISPKTVSSPTITLSTSTYTYSGSACQPIPTVKDGTTTISSSEYTVSYSDNTNAGTATCTISDVTGGNYTVSGSKTFTINPKALTITAKAQTINYGSSIATGTGQVTTSGLVSGDSLTAITLTASTNQVPGGTIKPSAASTTKGASNYNITYNTGNLTINKATPTYTAPTAKTGLVYQDQAQYLVNFGTSFDGTVKYEVTLTNTKPSSTSGFNLVPTGTNAVTYYVWWYVQGDSNHNDTAISSTAITVSIAKANPTYTAPAPISNLVYNGNDQDLFTPGSTSHGTIQFSPDGSTRWVDTVPYAETAGSYTAYWRLVGDNNHNDVAATAIIAIIAKATPSYTAPTALVPTYTGSAQALVSAGSSTEGTFTYSTS